MMDSPTEGRPFERVYTVWDYYDGPRMGFADFNGAPHAYRSIFRDDLDDWDPENRFELSPISREVLEVVLEQWAMWRRWEEAFHAGHTPQSTHPALPEDRPRFDETLPVIERALEIDPVRRLVAVGDFRTEHAPGRPYVPSGRNVLTVRWTPAEFDPASPS